MMSNLMNPRGFSGEAEFLDRATSEARRNLLETNSIGISSTLYDELAAVWLECRDPNWDGYNAMPVSRDTLRNAYMFLEGLPPGTPAPLVGAEPDGSLTFEWHRSPQRTLSISIGPDGDLHYSALFGASSDRGTEAFFGEVPEAIIERIRRVYTA